MLFPKKQQCFILWICVLNPALYSLKKTGFNRKSCTCTLVKTMICVFCISSLNVIIYFSKNTHNFYSQKNNKSTIPIFRGGAMCRRYYTPKNVILRLEYLITDTGYFMKNVLSATCVHQGQIDNINCTSVHYKYLLYEISCSQTYCSN